MVPAGSGGIPRVPPYSGTARTHRRFGYGAFTLSGQPFQAVPLAPPRPRGRPYNPGTRRKTPPVWAVPLSIASTRGIVLTFFSCGYLDVSVPRVRFLLYRMTGSLPPGCPIRTSATHRVFASYRGFSQLITSFFASESLGIPHAPFSDFVISSNASGKCHSLFRLAYCFLYTICSSVTRNLRLYILRYISLPVLSMSSFLGGE